VNGEAKVQCRKGFFHRIEQEITSYFFKWFIYGQSLCSLVELGRSTYIPKKLVKQARRFRFVKFQEVRDVGELLSRMSDIWMGTFKLMGEPFMFQWRGDKEGEEWWSSGV
jgi:hypothetical protein